MTTHSLHPALARALAIVVAATALATASATAAFASNGAAPAPAGTNLAPVKRYLLKHTALLTGFTNEFRAVANRYYATARAAGFDYSRLGATKRASVARDLARAKALWIAGNPYYERVEGVVAGTPSLAVYDVILDAGSSAKEDPASAVPVRPEAPERQGPEEARQPLQPHRGHALGHAPRVRRRQGRSRRRRPDRVRRGASRRERAARPRPMRSSSTPASSTGRRRRGSRRPPMRSRRSS